MKTINITVRHCDNFESSRDINGGIIIKARRIREALERNDFVPRTSNEKINLPNQSPINDFAKHDDDETQTEEEKKR